MELAIVIIAIIVFITIMARGPGGAYHKSDYSDESSEILKKMIDRQEYEIKATYNKEHETGESPIFHAACHDCKIYQKYGIDHCHVCRYTQSGDKYFSYPDFSNDK